MATGEKESRNPGVDGMTIEEFSTYARSHWQEIRTALMDGRYRPSAVRRVEIPKPSGGTRKLGIPTVIDRVIQQAIAQVLTPIFDPEFSESSFGFRPKRSAHDAVKKVREHISDGYSTFKHRIRKLIGRSNGISMEIRVAELNRYIQGWMNYFVLSKYWTPIPELDAWIRRRIRCCHWKQWRHCRTRVREMHARGVNRSCAWQLALTGHGPWYYSDHSALAQALTNSCIHQELGLVSLRDRWCRFHYPS